MDREELTEFVEKVRAASDILGVVSSYVSLKRKGKNFWGCCPFHGEKTPSFSVKPDEGFFYCFGCHAGGDVFKFISLEENISYFEAIKLQAERLNIPMPKRERTKEQEERDRKFSDMRKVNALARDFFHSALTKTSYGEEGLKYLAGRGMGKDIIEEFSLGFAPDSFDKLLTAFTKRGIKKELLEECGLVVQRERGLYDKFRRRLMIPIADEFGNVVGFGGRVVADGEPKYLNSPETIIFNKRKLLFGLDRAKKAIKDAGFAIVVEGYMDAISLFAAGIKNVVATLGTAFTLEQCRKLIRFSPKIYFCYDSDEAGQKATMRALSVVKETGARVRVLVVPDGKDPDEFVRKHGAEEFSALVEKAEPITEFQIKYVLKHNDYRTLEGKAATLKEILPILAGVTSIVELNDYIIRTSRVLGIDEETVRRELKGFSPLDTAMVTEPIRRAASKVDNAVKRAGRTVLRRVWQDGENGVLLTELLRILPYEDMPSALLKEIFAATEETLLAGKPLSMLMSEGKLSEQAQAELAHALSEESDEDTDIAAYDDSVNRLRLEHLKAKYDEYRMRAEALSGADDEKALEALRECQNIKKEMDELSIG